MSTNLDTIVQSYLDDSSYQRDLQVTSRQRDDSIPFYKTTIGMFIAGRLNLTQLYNELNILNKDRFWGANGSGFLLEIGKLKANHVRTNPTLENDIRVILHELHAQNSGQQIEQFYLLMQKDGQRLVKSGLHHSLCVLPANSAFIISLLALWLDREHEPPIYYRNSRIGLARLLNARLLPTLPELQYDAYGVIIRTANNHQAVLQLLNRLLQLVPELKTSAYWAEYFLSWITHTTREDPKILKQVFLPVSVPQTRTRNRAEAATNIKQTPENIPSTKQQAATTDQTIPVAKTPLSPQAQPLVDAEQPSVPQTQPPIYAKQPPVAEHASVVEVPPMTQIFPDHELSIVAEAALQKNMAELRRHLIIAESVIRRIYHALLHGHVILTGPSGTGKTELALLIPELLWHDQTQEHSAYATTLVTATSDWGPHTLINDNVPLLNPEQIVSRAQFGYLVEVLMKNWALTPEQFPFIARTSSYAASFVQTGTLQNFHGHWLVIDEFQRAPIDIALGKALTIPSHRGELQLLIDSGEPVALPIPQDFRLIGTLNSSDHQGPGQISETLKRRFTFIEILPPSRAYRQHEQQIVLFKALQRCLHVSKEISADESGIIWRDTVFVYPDEMGWYDCVWEEQDSAQLVQHLFYTVIWPLLEVLRIYYPLGTAQVITLLTLTLTPPLLQHDTTKKQWLEALDNALCDTLIAQLQSLSTTELEVFLWYLKLDADTFMQKYNAVLSGRRTQYVEAHLEKLAAIVDNDGRAYLNAEQIEKLLTTTPGSSVQVAPEILIQIFHLDYVPEDLPLFTQRLHLLKAENT